MVTGRHVLWALLGAFGVILIANGAFVFFAATTFPGNEVDDSYRRGLDYNETLRADRGQRADGWSATIVGTEHGVEVNLENPSKGSGAGLVLAGEIRRPGRPDLDRTLGFEEIAVGRYQSDIELEPGRWELIAIAKNAGGAEILRLHETLHVRAP